MDKLKTQYPVIDKINESSGEIRMTAEEHRAYVDYLNIARQMEDMERQHIYFRGHTDAVAYLKKSKRYKVRRKRCREICAAFLLAKMQSESKNMLCIKSFSGFSAKTID